ncbi:MAG TPA: RebB family R body protein, partial [Polyangia bacterium]
MRQRFQRSVAVGSLATVISLGLAGCSNKPAGTKTGEERASAPAPRLPAIRAQFPSARTDGSAGGVVRLYGTALATGSAPAEAADNFKQTYASAMGIAASDLVAKDVATGRAAAAGATQGIGLMYDEKTGQPRF